MPKRLASLTALVLAACAAETPKLQVAAVSDDKANRSVTEQVLPPHEDLASATRAFFFTQADLYLSGASPADTGPLADVLRAMGRDDLVQRVSGNGTDLACPRAWVEPVEMIAQVASGSHFVIIESERGEIAHIAFVEEIVNRLAADGFAAFADDGITLGPGGMGDPVVPLVTEGLAAREPGYGRLLRTAKRLNLQLVDAGVWWTGVGELTDLSPGERIVRNQAALTEQVFRLVHARSPDMRAIVHIQGSGDQSGARALRDSIRRFTGHTPLVVALATCKGSNSAFLAAPGEGRARKTQADFMFGVPQAPMKAGRLTSHDGSGEEAVAVPAAFLPRNLPVLIEVRRKGDPELAMPEDRLMLLPGERLPLMLAPGEYRIEAWTKQGKLAEAVSLNVT